MWKVIVVVLQVLVLVMLGSATRLENTRKIELQGAISGEGNFNGGEDIKITTIQANTAILTGKISLTGTSGDKEETGMVQGISYPEGYNKNNCFVISIGFSNVKNTNNSLITYGSLTADVRAINHGGVDKEVILKDDGITLISSFYWGEQLNEDRTDTYDFNIVLMKK